MEERCENENFSQSILPLAFFALCCNSLIMLVYDSGLQCKNTKAAYNLATFTSSRHTEGTRHPIRHVAAKLYKLESPQKRGKRINKESN